MESSSENTPKQKIVISEENKELIPTLPRDKGWVAPNFYQYEDFWYNVRHLQAVIATQKHFQPQDSDILLATNPKSGTTWLKAIAFTILNRKQHLVAGKNHPLLSQNPHLLVPFLEMDLYIDHQIPDPAAFPSPRLLSTHIPYLSLPESLRNTSKSKIVYLCRNPKDTFISLWHFSNQMKDPSTGELEIEDAFDRFCNGISLYGPFWDHILQYWQRSVEDPERVLFVRYEEMKERPAVHLRRLAEFLGCPFAPEEEESGMVEETLRLCSFGNLSGLQVNKTGKGTLGLGNEAFFRRGVVGDWKVHLSGEMADRIDRVVRDKFAGSGLLFSWSS